MRAREKRIIEKVSVTASLYLLLSMPVAAMGNETTALNTIPLVPQAPIASPMDGLKDMGETVRRLEKSLTDIMKEVQRHDQVEIVNPWFQDGFWGDPYYAYSMMYPIADNPPISFQDDGPLLPPRQKWLNYFMGQVNNLVGILSQEVQSVQMPDAQSTVKVEAQVLNDTFNTVRQHSQELMILTQVDKPDNDAILKKATLLRDDVAGMELIRKKILSAIVSSNKKHSG